MSYVAAGFKFAVLCFVVGVLVIFAKSHSLFGFLFVSGSALLALQWLTGLGFLGGVLGAWQRARAETPDETPK